MSPEALGMLIDHFDVAVRVPEDVARLKQLILQLAVRGRLVAQEPGDEPAGVFFKQHLSQRMDTRARNDLDEVASNNTEQLYQLPVNWYWIQLEDLGSWANGAGFPLKYQGITDLPYFFCKVSDMNLPGNEVWITAANNTIDLEIAKELKVTLHPQGTIIFPKIGGAIATNKRRILARPSAIDNNCMGIVPHPSLNIRWVYLVLTSIDFSMYQSGTSVPALSQRVIGKISIGLPPIPEQHRIVARVDELFALAGAAAGGLAAEGERRRRYHTAALAKLTQPAAGRDTKYEIRDTTASELVISPGDRSRHSSPVTHHSSLVTHFDRLYADPAAVAELKQAILQLAVMGRLVAQEPGDEPAGVLLERIAAERGASGIKTTLALRPIADDDVPYSLPDAWKWARFCEVAEIASNLTDPRNYGSLPHVAPNNIESGSGKLLYYRTVQEDEVRSSNHHFFPGQIIYSKIRPNLSKVVIVDFEGLCSADMYPVNSLINPRFLLLYMLSSTFLAIATRKDTRVAMPKINQMELNQIPVPIPPTAEQHRIVARVDELFALADAAAGRGAAAEAARQRWAERVMNQEKP